MRREKVQGFWNVTGGKFHVLLLAVAMVAYGLVVFSGFIPTFTGAAISSLAMLALGIALWCYTNARLGPIATQPRVGARTQLMQRRYRRLVFVSTTVVYLVLMLGAVVTDHNAIWACLAVPLCSTPNDLALLAMVHRVLAVLATLLIALLAFQTWRVRVERSLRFAAGLSLALILVQNAVGIGQILFLHASLSDVAMIVRISHLTIGAVTWSSVVVLTTLALRPPVVNSTFDVTHIPSQSSSLARYRALFKDYLSLTKPGVITLLIFTTLAAMFITPAGLPSLKLVFWTMFGGWLMPAGAHALNCYFDRDIDIKMGRTGRRPLPSNRIPAWHALVLGITLAIVSFIVLSVFVNLLTALLAFAGFVYYVGVYTLWLKRSSPSNIVIGGGAGAFPPLVGWAAVTGSLTLPSLFLFAIIFYWTPPHFWALALIRQKDYANAGVPMLPVVAGADETKWQIVLYMVLMVVLTLLLTPLRLMGVPYLIMALILGGIFARYTVRLWREGTTSAAWSLYKFSLLYLALLFGAMVIDRTLLAHSYW